VRFLLQSAIRLGLLLLAGALLAQPFCAARVSSEEQKSAPQSQGCHEESSDAPSAPAAPARCCVIDRAQKAAPSARFSLPEISVQAVQPLDSQQPLTGRARLDSALQFPSGRYRPRLFAIRI
jgi:hypothetical protein